jgi:hypothetical protein
VGTYNWVATYDGDTNNASVSSACTDEPVTIGQATPTITTAPDPTSGPVGTSVSDSASVIGGFNPTGTVTFQLFPPSDTTCSEPPAFTSTNQLTTGSATSGSFTTPAVGTFRWVATYDGDANNAPVISGCTDEPVTIDQATPTIATTASAGGPVGTAISDTATVSGGFNPTGTVTFELFPPGSTTCTGPAVFTSTNPLTTGSATSDTFGTTALGTYHWVATYNGDVNNASVSSACGDEPVTTTIDDPTIQTVPSLAGGLVGISISDTATVSGGFNPTGTVTFALFPPSDTTCSGAPDFTSTNALTGSPPSATSGSFTPTALGTYNWVATYSGDTDNTPVSSACGTEPVIIADSPTVTKTVTSNTQNPDGTWTIVYDIAVTSPNPPPLVTPFTLTDVLGFGQNIKINSATATGPAAIPSWNGTTDTTIANASVNPLETLHYTVMVNATVLDTATDSDRTCAAGGGFLNTATVTLPPEFPDPSASACADPASPTVTKSVVSVVVGSTPGQWVVTYEVTAANGSGAQLSYSLDDELGFPAGVTVTSTSASRVHSGLDGSGATPAQQIAGWTGTGSGAVLASNQLLPAQSKDTYTIVVGATVTSGLSAVATACNASGAGHGYFNAATLTSGSDSFKAQACDPITSPPSVNPSPGAPTPGALSPQAPASSGLLAFTGLLLSQEILFAAAFLGMGAILVLVSKRRRSRRAH